MAPTAQGPTRIPTARDVATQPSDRPLPATPETSATAGASRPTTPPYPNPYRTASKRSSHESENRIRPVSATAIMTVQTAADRQQPSDWAIYPSRHRPHRLPKPV